VWVYIAIISLLAGATLNLHYGATHLPVFIIRRKEQNINLQACFNAIIYQSELRFVAATEFLVENMDLESFSVTFEELDLYRSYLLLLSTAIAVLALCSIRPFRFSLGTESITRID
jgi:hypothetical protein